MTDTATPVRVPLACGELPPEAMYQTLRWLYNSGRTVAHQIEKNSADVHKTMESFTLALDAAEELFYPPPEPEGPEGGLSLFAHAVRPDDQVYIAAHLVSGLREGAWVTIRTATRAGENVLWTTNDPTGRMDRLTMQFDHMVPFSVKRPI